MKGCLISILTTVLVIVSFVAYMFVQSVRDFNVPIEKAIAKNKFEKAERINRRQAFFQGNEAVPSAIRILDAKIEYLSMHNEKASSDKILIFLDRYPIRHTPFVGTSSKYKISRSNDKYNEEVSGYNSLLDKALTTAIALQNDYLADRLILKYKPAIVKESTSFFGLENKYSYSYQSQEDARQRLNSERNNFLKK